MFEETIEEFYDRSYVNFVDEKVLVFNSNEGRDNHKLISKAEVWSFEKTSNYLEHLKENETN